MPKTVLQPISVLRPLDSAGRVLAKRSSGKLKAKQAFKDEVDINSIVSRFLKSGVPIPAPQSKPTFYDMASLPSNLHDALMLRERLASTISALPPSLVSAYNSNPGAFLAAVDKHLASVKAAASKGPDLAPGKPSDTPQAEPAGDVAKPKA